MTSERAVEELAVLLYVKAFGDWEEDFDFDGKSLKPQFLKMAEYVIDTYTKNEPKTQERQNELENYYNSKETQEWMNAPMGTPKTQEGYY